MPDEGAAPLALCVQSEALDRVRYALVLAAAAAAVGRPVVLFFTDWATRALVREEDGTPGWQAMPVAGPDGDARVFAGRTEAAGAPGFEELLESCTALGVRFLVCETGLLVAGVEAGRLRDDLPVEVTGAVTFLAAAPPGATTFFV